MPRLSRVLSTMLLVTITACGRSNVGPPPPDRSATHLETGPALGCITDGDGDVWCWDATLAGADGRPVALPFEVADPIVSMSFGFSHGCGVTSVGALWCWGDNTFGQLGVDGASGEGPVLVEALPSVVGVAAGGLHTCAWAEDGESWCWGDNRFGQLGDGSRTTRTTPVIVSGSHSFEQLSTGLNTTCGVVDDRIDCWGDNATGVITTTSDSIVPVPTTAMSEEAASVTVGESHVCARSVTSDIYCWGQNDVGQVGDGTTDARATPIRVLPDGKWTSVDTGPRSRHTCAVHEEGPVFCWGENGWQQSGVESIAPVLLPTLINSVRVYTEVSTGWRMTCALDPQGGVSCWGSLQPSRRSSSPLRVVFAGS